MSNELSNKAPMSPKLSPDEDPKESDERLVSGPVNSGGGLDESSSEGSSEENEDTVENAYLPLPQDEGENVYIQQFAPPDSLEEEDVTDQPEQTEQEQPASSALSQPMAQEQVDLIKKVMSGITLPSTAIPDWAKFIPEESWKAELVSSISTKNENQQTDSTSSSKQK